VSVARAAPTPDVLPSGVRRRLGARDAWLAGVLAAELLAGAAVGAVWEARAELGWLVLPAPAAAEGDASGQVRTATTWVVVPPPLPPTAPPPPARRTVPRSPFEVQAG
jgi:hypothetical protein